MPRHFKNWLKTYIEEYTQHSEAPTLCHFWTGVGTIGAVLRRRTVFKMGYFEWTPNFYIVLVGPPGVITKSTTLNVGMELLKQIPNVHIGANNLTAEALPKDLSAAQELLMTAEGSVEPMSCLTFASSELGTLLDPQDRKMMDFLTDLWDGWRTTWRKSTATQGKDQVTNPWVNILACTTPSWLKNNMPQGLVGGGFTSRCIFVFGDRKRKFVAYPGLNFSAEHEIIRQKLIEDLIEMSHLYGEFILTPEAIVWGEEWYQHHWENPPKDLNPQQFGGYIARKQGHVHKLAMVLSVAESDDLVIEKRVLERAAKMVSALEPDMQRVFHATDRDATIYEKLERVEGVLAAHGTIAESALYRYVETFMTSKEYREVLHDLMMSGKIGLRQAAHTKFVDYKITPPVEGENEIPPPDFAD